MAYTTLNKMVTVFINNVYIIVTVTMTECCRRLVVLTDLCIVMTPWLVIRPGNNHLFT